VLSWGPGTATTHLFKLQPRDGPGAGGGRPGDLGEGGGDAGYGKYDGDGTAFPACAAPRPATGSRAQTIEKMSGLERREPG
jgi:hypothetical protein